MKKYLFYKDQKLTIWQRCYIEVEASSEEEAIANVRRLSITDNLSDYETEYEYLYDTAEEISIEENSNNPTIEVYSENGELIFTNLNKSI